MPSRQGGVGEGVGDGEGGGAGAGKKGMGVAGMWATTKDYAGWWAKHVKKGEMPWTQVGNIFDPSFLPSFLPSHPLFSLLRR